MTLHIEFMNGTKRVHRNITQFTANIDQDYYTIIQKRPEGWGLDAHNFIVDPADEEIKIRAYHITEDQS